MTNYTISSTSIKSAGYYSLFIIIVGTLLNLLTLIVFCRASFRDAKKLPAIHYIRAITILDTLMLYGWNLDHLTVDVYGWSIKGYSIAGCKIINFISYFATQSSAWCRVFLCLDRYLSFKRLHRTWMGQSKGILIIITVIIVIFFLFNLHILLFGCFRESNDHINGNARNYLIYPVWDYIQLVVYDALPFVLMTLLNVGVIYHLIQRQRTSTAQTSGIHHRTISITLVVTTTLFLIMTVPTSIIFSAFSMNVSRSLLTLMDGIYFTYHILSFPLYFITYPDFRRECWNLIRCHQRKTPIAPAQGARPPQET